MTDVFAEMKLTTVIYCNVLITIKLYFTLTFWSLLETFVRRSQASHPEKILRTPKKYKFKDKFKTTHTHTLIANITKYSVKISQLHFVDWIDIWLTRAGLPIPGAKQYRVKIWNSSGFTMQSNGLLDESYSLYDFFILST